MGPRRICRAVSRDPAESGNHAWVNFSGVDLVGVRVEGEGETAARSLTPNRSSNLAQVSPSVGAVGEEYLVAVTEQQKFVVRNKGI